MQKFPVRFGAEPEACIPNEQKYVFKLYSKFLFDVIVYVPC